MLHHVQVVKNHRETARSAEELKLRRQITPLSVQRNVVIQGVSTPVVEFVEMRRVSGDIHSLGHADLWSLGVGSRERRPRAKRVCDQFANRLTRPRDVVAIRLVESIAGTVPVTPSEHPEPLVHKASEWLKHVGSFVLDHGSVQPSIKWNSSEHRSKTLAQWNSSEQGNTRDECKRRRESRPLRSSENIPGQESLSLPASRKSRHFGR